jgi:hypothetical protein
MMFNQRSYLLLCLVVVSTAAAAASSSNVINTITNHQQIRRTGDGRKLQLPDLPSWAEGWLNETNGSTDWSSDTAWMDWFDNLWANSGADGMDICPLLETAVGMGQAFGIEADCTCTGDMMTEMQIACSFDQCVDASTIVDGITAVSASRQADNSLCGTIGLNITFGGTAGGVTTSVCADFPGEQYKETCFSYEVSMVPGSTPTQSCMATYGGLECDCSIDNTFCLNVNCSSYLPGAAIDTCQVLSMRDEKDLMSWLPQFQVFASNFSLGTLFVSS